ncbi:MAG: SLC13 family permease [Alphaproteobacteria bacterium]|nr:SLC13 family permease [Alphaproteobacteria bacterium]
MTLPIALTLLIAVVAIAAFVSGRFRLETVAVGLLLALLFLFVTVEMPDARAQPGMVFAGFANTGLITLMALLIVARGLTETGALSRIADLINRMARHRRGVVFVCLLLIAALTSSFINNTPIVLIFIPILILVASDRLPPSRTLIPLSYASILGGMTTLVGSSTNLIAAGVAVELGLPPFDFFAFTIPGLVVAGAGLVYVTAILPWLLPKLESEAATPVDSRQFVTEIEVRSDSPAVGEASVGGMFPGLEEMTVFSVRRGLDTYLFPFEDVVLRAGDVLVVALSRTRFPSILGSLGGLFRTARMRAENEANFFAEAVVTVDSPFTRTPPMTPETFRRRTGCTILGLRRTRLTNRRGRPLEVPLQSGDMLLVEGTQSAVSDLRQTGIVVPTEWRQSQLPPVKFRWRAAGIFLGTVLAASSGVVPVVVAAVAGAFSMIASGTLSVGRALGAIDGRVALPVAAMLGLSGAMQMSGAAQWVADGAVQAMDTFGFGPAAMMSALFLVTAITTDILTNNAAALLYMPIAIGIAQILGVDPFPFAVTVIFGANMSFSTPIGYQTNLLVMGPAGYRGRHYLRSGPPLTLICWGTFTLFVPWYYGIS